MAVCEGCEEIAQGKSDASGHDGLISLGYVRSLAAAKRGSKHEAFLCTVCDTEWDYFHGQRAVGAGWTRAQG